MYVYRALCSKKDATLAAKINKRSVGTFGDASTFSFYPTKNLGGIGDSGAIVTNNNEIGEKVKKLRQYGWSNKYNVTESGGRNSRMDEIQASSAATTAITATTATATNAATTANTAAGINATGTISIVCVLELCV